MELKKGVNIRGTHPMMQIANCKAAVIWYKHGQELMLTSGLDGTHGKGSLHPLGRADDYRTWYFKDKFEIDMIATELRDELGEDYDVVVEDTHIHCEYDPQNPKII